MNAPSLSAVPGRREREKQERRAAILAAAERVIISRGFAEASIDGIAREAGLAAGTVYLYFPNKEALLQDLLCSKVRLLNQAVAKETSAEHVFHKALPAVVRAMFRHFEDHRGFFEIFARERMDFSRGASREDGVFQEIEAGTAQMTKWIAAAQRAGALPCGTARQLATSLRGLVFQFTRDWLRGGGTGRLTQHTAFVSGFFLRGAGA